MRNVQETRECKYFMCLRCDEQFYCAPEDRRPSCPLCGTYNEEFIISMAYEDQDLDYDRYYD